MTGESPAADFQPSGRIGGRACHETKFTQITLGTANKITFPPALTHDHPAAISPQSLATRVWNVAGLVADDDHHPPGARCAVSMRLLGDDLIPNGRAVVPWKRAGGGTSWTVGSRVFLRAPTRQAKQHEQAVPTLCVCGLLDASSHA